MRTREGLRKIDMSWSRGCDCWVNGQDVSPTCRLKCLEFPRALSSPLIDLGCDVRDGLPEDVTSQLRPVYEQKRWRWRSDNECPRKRIAYWIPEMGRSLLLRKEKEGQGSWSWLRSWYKREQRGGEDSVMQRLRGLIKQPGGLLGTRGLWHHLFYFCVCLKFFHNKNWEVAIVL